MDTDFVLVKQKAINAFSLGYDMGVQAAKAYYAKKKGENNENQSRV